MDTPETESGYIPMNSVHSFRFDSSLRSENIYENPQNIKPVGWSRKVAKQVRGHVLCLGLPCVILLVVVLLLLKNNMQKDQLQENYINLTRERETLNMRLYQLDRLKHDLTEEKSKLERRLAELDNIQRNLTVEKERLQSNITELDQRNKKLIEEENNIQRTLSNMRWYSFNYTWYYISRQRKNWNDSRVDCQGKGGDLVVINSKEEQLFLAHKAVRAWIGLTDMDEEGTWKWVDGTNVTTAYWGPGQPNDKGQNGSGQNCALIWDRTNRLRTWNDEECSKTALWICEV
ncbi:hypothetical protein ACEWY4_024098 [Coilia grayii]|uniref:C-type lectin domain-containing protein n=1 Tax=Coilia grayii TaxID=363190 RepID=A0ABD1J1D8_9TELE